MSEMVERVARALRDSRMVGGEFIGLAGERYKAPPIEDFYGWAKVAIAEMREPTTAMTNGGNAIDDYTTQFVQAASSDAHWQAMIDAALAD